VSAARSPEDLHNLFAQGLNSGDLDALVALYAFDGFLMTRGGPGGNPRALAGTPPPAPIWRQSPTSPKSYPHWLCP
jgi:hypothetical protein